MALESTPRYDPERLSATEGHAVVLGGSIAGMAVARVLADAYRTVTVVERDPLPEEPLARRGVPQAGHIHMLLEAGRAALEDLFPGFSSDLLAAGGHVVDASSDLAHYEKDDFLADGPDRIPLYSASRPLFEHVVRRHLIAHEEVRFRSNCQFRTYLADEEGVTGVVVDGGTGRTDIEADLVVDATGRTSRTPTWLAEHGYERPPVEEVHVDVAYSSVLLRRPPGNLRAFLVVPSPSCPRGGAVAPLERDRWVVTLFGVHDEKPPTDPGGFVSYADSLPTPEIGRLLAEHAWVSEDVEHYPFPSNLRRRYDRLEDRPDGLLVTGDGIASFNPIYGQGMSVAALEAGALHHVLAAGDRRDLAADFFDRVTEIVDVAWQLAVSSDFEFADTAGPKPVRADLFNRYRSRIVRAAHSDGRLRNEYYRVVLMEKPWTALLRPNVLGRVLLPEKTPGLGFEPRIP